VIVASPVPGTTPEVPIYFSLVEHRDGVRTLVGVDSDDEHNVLLMAVRWGCHGGQS